MKRGGKRKKKNLESNQRRRTQLFLFESEIRSSDAPCLSFYRVFLLSCSESKITSITSSTTTTTTNTSRLSNTCSINCCRYYYYYFYSTFSVYLFYLFFLNLFLANTWSITYYYNGNYLLVITLSMLFQKMPPLPPPSEW